MPAESPNKNFEAMSYADFEQDPVYGPVLQEMALVYLQNIDKDFFTREYSGERDENGYLKKKDGTNSNTLPSQNITSGMALVVEMTKQRLRLKS